MKNKYKHHKTKRNRTFLKPLTIWLPENLVIDLHKRALKISETVETIAALSVAFNKELVYFEQPESVYTYLPIEEKYYNLANNIILATSNHGLNYQDYIMIMTNFNCNVNDAQFIIQEMLDDNKIELIKTKTEGTLIRFVYSKKQRQSLPKYKTKNVNKKPVENIKTLVKKGKR